MTGGWIGSIQKMDVQVMIPRACSSRAESKEGVHIERRGYMPIAYLSIQLASSVKKIVRVAVSYH